MAPSNVWSELSSSQFKVLAIAPKVTSGLSIGGSLYVFCRILASCGSRSATVAAGRNIRTYTNLLLGLSFADLITAIAYFLTTWPIPTDTIYSDYIWGEAGNQTTCNIQGAMFQFGAMSSIMYTCSLSLHFLLSVRYRWLPSDLKTVHPFMHVACICIPAAAAVLGWFQTLYNPTAYACYLQSYPFDCDASDGVSCIRGTNIKMYMTFMMAVPIFLGLVVIGTAMILIYSSVCEQDRQISRYRIYAEDKDTMSRQTFRMACQYVAAFAVAFVPSAVIALLSIVAGHQVAYVSILINSLLSPLQGFLNAFVYSRDFRSKLETITEVLSSAASSLRQSTRHLRASGENNMNTTNNNMDDVENGESKVDESEAENPPQVDESA